MPLTDRVPPQNLEAERSVLGAMLIRKEAITEVQEILRADDFYRESHKIVFASSVVAESHTAAPRKRLGTAPQPRKWQPTV